MRHAVLTWLCACSVAAQVTSGSPAAVLPSAADSAVSGRLLAYNNRPLQSASVVLAPRERASGTPAVLSASMLPDGRFTFRNVPEGRYVVRARGMTEPNGLTLFAQEEVSVLGRAVDGLALTLRPGATLEGLVTFTATRGTPRPPAGSLQVRAPFTDGSGFGDALTGTVRRDGSFVIRGVMEGPHRLIVEGLQPPWAVARIDWNGHDIIDQTIDAEEGAALRGVRISLIDAAALVTGVVRGADNLPAAAGVLVFPVAPELRDAVGRRMRLTRTGDDGRYAVYGLPPGDYLALAAAELSEIPDAATLASLQPRAVAFTIDSPTARATVDLRLTEPQR